MSTVRPFAYNTGSTISGTTQVGSLAIGADAQDYSGDPGGVKWWMGPDEDLGFIVGLPVPAQNHSTPVGDIAGVEFWRSTDFTNESFTSISNFISVKKNEYTGFTNTVDAKAWIDDKKYYTSFTGATFEDESLAFFNRITGETPSQGLKELINKTIRDLKDADIWNYIDVLRLMNLHTEEASLLNVKSSDFGNGTNVNYLLWVPKLGFKGQDTALRYIDSGFNPSTGGYNFTQDMAFYGGFASQEVESTTRCLIVQSNNTYIVPRGTAGNSYRARILTNNTNIVTQNVNSAIGLTIGNRRESTKCGWLKNGVFQNLMNDNSVALVDSNFWEIGGLTQCYPAYVKNTVYGGELDNAKHLILYNILNYFNNNVSSVFIATYEDETYIQKNRIEADGGTVIDLDWMNTVISTLKTMDVYSNAKMLLDGNFAVKKDEDDLVTKLYDISGNNNDATQLPAVNIIPNGTFSSTSYWYNLTYWNITGGTLNYFNSSATSYCYTSPIALTAGVRYLVEFDKINTPSNGRFVFYNGATTAAFAAPYNTYVAFDSGHNSVIMTCATNVASSLRIYGNSGYGAFSIDNLTITPISQPTWSLEGGNGVITYNGTEDWMVVPKINVTEITMASRFKSDNLTGSHSLFRQYVSSGGFSIRTYSDHNEAFLYRGALLYATNSGSTISLETGNTYTNISTYDKTTGDLKVYVNGELDQTMGSAGGSISIDAYNLYIGAYYNGSTSCTDLFDGIIYSSSVFDIPLTPAQVTALNTLGI